MAGANYMGGRRNSVKTKLKDVAGRMQKGHFMRQKHQILSRGLMNTQPEDKEHHSTQNTRIEDISFAHAKKDLRLKQTGKTSTSSVQRKTPAQILLPSSSPDSRKRNLLKNSKILEDLDINEPSGLKATLRRILREPDLAGLSYAKAKSRAAKLYGISEGVSDNCRRQKRSREETSTGSSSSFPRDYPAAKPSHRPLSLVEHPLENLASRLSAKDPSSDAHVSTYSSSLLAEEGDTRDDSPCSSSERISDVQDIALNSSHSETGFSEFQFSESVLAKGCAYAQEDFTRNLKEISLSAKAGPISSTVFSADNYIANKPIRKETKGKSLRIILGSHMEGSPLRSECFHEFQLGTSPVPGSRSGSTSAVISASRSYDISESQSTQSCVASPTELHSGLAVEAKEEQRYGVGYVPPDPYSQYRPFVPYATMLLSYSDEDYTDVTDGADVADDYQVEEPMEIDEQMDDLLVDESQSIREAETTDNSSSPTAWSSYMRNKPARWTTPRRFISSPVRRLSAPHRIRLSSLVERTTPDILGPGDIEEYSLPYSGTATPSPRKKFPVASEIFKSGSTPQENAMKCGDAKSQCMFGTSLYRSPSDSPTYNPGGHEAAQSRSTCRPASTHSLVTRPAVNSTATHAGYLNHAIADLTSQVASRSLGLSIPCSVKVSVTKDFDSTSALHVVEGAKPRVDFNGPDLFAGDIDDDND